MILTLLIKEGMMKKKSLFFASLNISFPLATTTAVDRTMGTLKK